MINLKFIRIHASLLVFIILLLQGCASTGNHPNQVVDLSRISDGQEASLGKNYHYRAILKKYKVYRDDKLQAYVERVAAKIVANSNRKHLTYHFTILDTPIVNAFALPGGYIYITRGLLAYLNKESQLAGVIAHEVAHVTERHGLQRHAKRSQVGSVFKKIFSGSHNVQQELEADSIATKVLSRTSYNPYAMVELISILEKQRFVEDKHVFLNESKREEQADKMQRGISAKLNRDVRFRAINKEIRRYGYGRSSNVVGNDEFLVNIRGIAFGASRHDGVTLGNQYYKGDLNLRVEFPKGWTVKHYSNAVVAMSPNGNQNIQLQTSRLDNQMLPDEYLDMMFDGFRNGHAIKRVDNGSAYAGIGRVSNRKKDKSIDALVGVTYHNNKAVMIYGQGMNKLPSNEFANTLSSIRNLNANELEISQGQRIKLIRAKATDTFRSLAQRSQLDGDAEAQLRLLNNMFPKGEPNPGQILKLL